MMRKTADCSLSWCILCCMVVLFFCSCSSEKPETARTAAQTGDKTSAETSARTGSGESVLLSPSGEKGEEKGPGAAAQKSPPGVAKAGLRLENVNGVDRLRIVAEGIDKDGNNVALKYEWTKNDEPAGEGDTLSGFKRGDRISVRITPFNDQGYDLAKTVTTEIRNTTPKIVEHKEINFNGKVWSYQVKATDADGDALTYSLKAAPQGMTIGATTGFIKWEVPPQFVGEAPVTVSVTDGHGGEATYNFDVTMKAEASKPKQDRK